MTISESEPLQILCPECGKVGKVIDMRSHLGEYIRRRRECENGHRFTTYEFSESELRVKGYAR